MTTEAMPRTDLPRLLVEQSPDGVIFADGKGIIQSWNAAAQRIFGFAPDEALGRNLDIIIPERLRDAHWRGFDRALAAGATQYAGQALPTKAVRADGTTIYVELSFAVVTDEHGQPLGALAQARDITERFTKERASRKRLQELEKQLQAQNPT